MAEFSEDQKRFVIECWATDMTDSGEIATAFVNHFGEGTEIPTSAQLARYNPTYAAGSSLSKEHKALFDRKRKEFREDISTIPAAHKPFRVRELQTLYVRQKKKKSDVVAVDILKQIAQEMGKIFERPEPAATPAEIDAYVANMATQFRTAVENNVTDEEVRKSVLAEIEAKLEGSR